MAERPVFISDPATPSLIREHLVQFKWVPGMAISQAQKCIVSLHASVKKLPGVEKVLDISSKSPVHLGVALSAFNLRITLGTMVTTVESAYQGSKVFRRGGPYEDILVAPPMQAKRDPRIREGGPMSSFRLMGEEWPLEPKSAFYDWLYITALRENAEQARQLAEYDAFTDIAFNPAKSINCQARAAALYVALLESGQLNQALASQAAFLDLLQEAGFGSSAQSSPGLFGDRLAEDG